MAEEKPFNDCFLLALSHPTEENILDILETGEFKALKKQCGEDALKVIEKIMIDERLEFGKKKILENTKPGDLIAIERPKKASFELVRSQTPIKDGTITEKKARRIWDSFIAKMWNFYSELADFAGENGRRTISLEPSPVRPGSKLFKLHLKGGKSSLAEEVRHILSFRRTKSMMRRIQREKPKMVITAAGHGIPIEKIMQPKKVEYFPPIPLEYRKASTTFERGIRRYERIRKQRRLRKIKRLVEQGKLPKTGKRLTLHKK